MYPDLTVCFWPGEENEFIRLCLDGKGYAVVNRSVQIFFRGRAQPLFDLLDRYDLLLVQVTLVGTFLFRPLLFTIWIRLVPAIDLFSEGLSACCGHVGLRNLHFKYAFSLYTGDLKINDIIVIYRYISCCSIDFDVFEWESNFSIAPLIKLSDSSYCLKKIDPEFRRRVADVFVYVGQADHRDVAFVLVGC